MRACLSADRQCQRSRRLGARDLRPGFPILPPLRRKSSVHELDLSHHDQCSHRHGATPHATENYVAGSGWTVRFKQLGPSRYVRITRSRPHVGFIRRAGSPRSPSIEPRLSHCGGTCRRRRNGIRGNSRHDANFSRHRTITNPSRTKANPPIFGTKLSASNSRR